MDIITEFIMQITKICVLMFITYFIGSFIERKYFSLIKKCEENLKDILVFSEKHVLKDLVSGEFYLVKGSIVSSGSYFKRQTAGLKSNFGGRLGSMESFMDIGRREAVLRMKEQARIVGANIVFNVRFETVMIRRGKGLCAEFLVYGTAWKKIARADTKSTKTL